MWALPAACTVAGNDNGSHGLTEKSHVSNCWSVTCALFLVTEHLGCMVHLQPTLRLNKGCFSGHVEILPRG